MPDDTPKLEIPYTIPTDSIRDYPAVDQAAAERLEELLVPIAEIVLSAAAASFDVVGIPATFRHLRAVLVGRGTTAATLVGVNARLNNDSGANQYDATRWGLSGGGADNGELGTRTDFPLADIPGANHLANMAGFAELEIPFYLQTAFWKPLRSRYAAGYSLSPGVGARQGQYVGNWRSLAAVNRVTVAIASGNFAIGSRLALYGIPGG